MFLPGFARVFLLLNILRALSIISLLLVFASSVVELVDDVEAVNAFTNGDFNKTAFDAGNSENSTVPNQPGGAFWAVLNRIFIIFQTIVLVLSEIGWPASFLGSDFGLGALGVVQCLYVPLSAHALGCANMLFGLIFWEKAKDKRSVVSWRERRDVLPTHDKSVDMRSLMPPTMTGRSSGRTRETTLAGMASGSGAGSSRAGMGLGRQGGKGGGAER